MRLIRNRFRSGPILALIVALFTLPARPAIGQAPAPLARYAPREKLAFLLEFDGLESQAARWRQSAASKILSETKLGALTEDLLAQGLQAAVDAAPPGGERPTGKQLVGVAEALVRDGFVVAVSAAEGRKPGPTAVVATLRGGSRGAVRGLIDLVLRAGGRPPGPEKMAGRDVYRLGVGDAAPVCWFEKNDAVLTRAGNVSAVADVLDGRAANAVAHPIRAELSKPEDGFESVARGFVDLGAIPPMPPQAATLGLDGVKRVDFRWGFQDDALLTVVRVVAPSPRRGLLTLLDQPTFDKSSLPPLPASLSGFTVASVDLAKAFDLFDAMAAEEADRAPAAAKEAREAARKVRRDLLPHLGPKVAFYSAADPGVAGNPLAALVSPFGGLTLTAQTNDPAAVGRAIAPLIAMVNDAFKNSKTPRPPGTPAAEVRKTGDAPPRYVLDLPPGSVPPGPFAALQPTLIVGRSQVVLASKPSAADQALAVSDKADGRWAPTGAYEPMARRLPAGLVLLNVSDPRTTVPALVASLPTMVPFLNAAIAAQTAGRPAGANPARPPFALRVDPDKMPTADELSARMFPSSLALSVDKTGLRLTTRESTPSISSPATAGVLVALLLPAVQAAREAARRSQCVNNLKQIALAMHNYQSANGALPPVAIKDKAGKPLLSWRVAILPYLEQQGALYNKFHLDEPWDGPHNKPLIAAMPQSYQCPSRPTAGESPGLTCYRVFTGKTTAFPRDHAVKFAEIKDGLSLTLMAVETKEGVPWTKPDDLDFDPEADAPKPLFGAGSFHTGGFNAAILDGSVRFLKNSLDMDTLRGLITRDGGERVKID